MYHLKIVLLDISFPEETYQKHWLLYLHEQVYIQMYVHIRKDKTTYIFELVSFGKKH